MEKWDFAFRCQSSLKKELYIFSQEDRNCMKQNSKYSDTMNSFFPFIYLLFPTLAGITMSPNFVISKFGSETLHSYQAVLTATSVNHNTTCENR